MSVNLDNNTVTSYSLDKIFSNDHLVDLSRIYNNNIIDDMKTIIHRKRKYLNKRPNSISGKHFQWNDTSAIKQARGYGISCKKLTDSKDKLVITPKDIGCHSFEYLFNKDSWGECFNDIDNNDRIEYFIRLYNIGILLSKFGLEVYLIAINCGCKGYLYLYDNKISSNRSFLVNEDDLGSLEDCSPSPLHDYDYVLFVYH